MGIKKYLKGQGIDVSRNPILKIKNCKYFFVEPNNLYSLRNFVGFESQDFIYSKNLINETKFVRILIKEWFNFCKIDGNIIIEMKSNEILNFDKLINECKTLLKDKIKILKVEKNSGILVIKKLKKVLNKKDSIDKWSFGIVVDGRRDDIVDKCIDSIIKLNISNFEIILCGEKYNGNNKGKIKHIKTNPILSSHITIKKNIICKNSKYENIVIMHDRFIFDKDWYNGMKKYGNYFEVISCVVKDLKGCRVDDWITFGMEKDETDIGNLGLLDYRDWDINGFIPGGMYIIKKSVWKECKWEESLVWGQAEDKRISECFYKNGFVARFNPFSLCITTTERGRWPKLKFNKKRFILPKDRPLKGRIKNIIKRFCRKYILK